MIRRLITLRSKYVVVNYEIELRHWKGPDLRIAVLADLHVAAPWTTLADVAKAVTKINDMVPDLVVLGGDYLAGHALRGTHASADDIAAALTPLRAPLGVFAIMGNHDWFDCRLARETGMRESSVLRAFAETPITVLQNSAARVVAGGHDLWMVGFDSQRPGHQDWSNGLHRPEESYGNVPIDVPTILLAHEPDYFASNDRRAGLQISGHTHGGQLNLFGWRPMTPSQFGGRYAYGHIRNGDQHLVVSGGLGFSGLPVRICQPPEITVIRVKAQQ